MQGYPFEAAAMCGIILEQYGFAYAVFKMDDTEKILRIKVSKTISNLKRLLPYAGRVYSFLSSHSHLDPKDTRHYIDKEDGTPIVRYVLPESIKLVVYYFLQLVADFSIIVQEVSGDYLQLKRLTETSTPFKEDYDLINEAITALEGELCA